MSFFVNILKGYMRSFPINEGKRLIFNRVCKKLKAAPEVVTVVDGFKMELDPLDRNQQHTYWYKKFNEKDEVRIITRLLGEGDSFIDVGANLGYFTLAAARKVGGSGRVISIEPNPYTFRLLEKNLLINGFKHVELLKVAAGERNGKATLGFTCDQADRSSNIYKKNARHDGSVEVEMATLDTLVKERGVRPTVIKIDAEGYDEMVLSGSKAILESGAPQALLTETMNDRYKMADFLRQMDYDPYTLSGHRWSKSGPTDTARSNNTLWIKKDYTGRIKRLLG